jgi:probable rRNA maturation factor
VEVCNTCRSVIVFEESICELFRKLDKCERFRIGDGDLSISLISRQKMKAIHAKFLGDSSLTDVITFQGDSDLNFSGEILICPLYAFEQSKIYQTTFREEIKLYLIHGYLHLCGLEDKTEKEARHMRDGEAFCMNFLGDYSLQIFLRSDEIHPKYFQI